MSHSNQGYLPTLDGWRAVAILAVILDHVVAWRLQSTHPTIFTFTRVGANGVSLFFAISGFLICSRLLEEQTLTGRISLGGFYVRRAFRILPPALTYLVVIGLLGLCGLITVSSWEWWSSVFFFRNYLPPSLIHPGWGGYTVHYWSLAVEEHFYLLWPALLVLAGRKNARYLAGGMAVLVSCWRWWDFHHAWVDKHLPGLLFGSRTDVRLDGLLLGCMAALLLADARNRAWAVRNLKWSVWWGCVAVYALIQVLSRHHYYSLWESLLLTVIVVTTVLRPENWIGRVLEYPVMRWIGRLSYSLYIWQEFFASHETNSVLSILQGFPINMVLLFAIAWVSYQLIERPLMRLGHRLAPPPTPGRLDLSTQTTKS